MINYEHIGENLENLEDLGMTLALWMRNQTQSIQDLIHKLYFINIKNVCSEKDNIKRRRQATDWEKIFVKDAFDKALPPEICKELLKPNKKMSNLTIKWV